MGSTSWDLPRSVRQYLPSGKRYRPMPSSDGSLDPGRPPSPFNASGRVKAGLSLLVGGLVLLLVSWIRHGGHTRSSHGWGAQDEGLVGQVVTSGGEGSYPSLKRMDLGLDRTLSEAECNAYYPGLYSGLRKQVEYYQKRGKITYDELDRMTDKAQARILIHNNQMFVKDYRAPWGTRAYAALGAIQDAVLTSREVLPNIEFLIWIDDAPRDDHQELPLWVLTRKAGNRDLWLMPDFGFYSWPQPRVGGMAQVRENTRWREDGVAWSDKKAKLFWRGAYLVPIRNEVAEIAREHEWGDVDEIKWDNLNGKHIYMDEHCLYKYLLHVEGFSYSGRLKYLQMCRSVIVAHDMTWEQHFHHLFNALPSSPSQNMVIPPGPGFQGLPQVMQDLLSDDARAERIANNSASLFRRYLSPGATNCYWRQMFRSWAKVQAFETSRIPDQTSYESFNLMRDRVEWEPH